MIWINESSNIRSSHRRCSIENSIPEKKSLTQVLSCEFYKIFQNNFFTEHHRWLLLKDVKKMYSRIQSLELVPFRSST